MSRIFRSLEVGSDPKNYSVTDFEVCTEDSGRLTQQDISSHSLDIRVYNTDFVKENLSFLANENEGEIKPFAIIGSENQVIEQQLQKIEEELGDSEAETGIEYELARMREKQKAEKREAEKAEKDLKKELGQHANQVIKKNRVYGDPNYNINAIGRDIETIRQESVTALEPPEVDEKTKLLQEKPLSNINTRISFTPKVKALYARSAEILATEVKPSKTIKHLFNDPPLQTWVRKGMDYHRDKEFCGFCGQDLPEDFWEKLDAHFSKESSDLEKKIKQQIALLEQEIEGLSSILLPEKEKFYESVRSSFRDAKGRFHDVLESYRRENQKLLDALKARQKNIFTPEPQPDYKDLSEEISNCICELNKIITGNNQKTQTLSEDQETARQELRLNDVLNFINKIGLRYREQEISGLKTNMKETEKTLLNIELRVQELNKEKEYLQTKLRDERRGAERVNEYLNHSLGLDSLRLEAEEDAVDSKYKFQIMRGDKPAYNLSEGERSLVSFCYFMAKLEDTETLGKDLIIYIDDPISSLDSSHIFFVYSLIESVLAKPEKNSDRSNRYRYKQLFISTHNLDFLKYLKRLSAPNEKHGRTEFFLIEKDQTSSTVRLMPRYLKDYQTEFIYLFDQIYKCSTAKPSEENYQMFYSLGNNLRKFLEVYLFYKYPFREDENDKLERLRNFFGDDGKATALTNRIINEFSHLEDSFDRSMRPVDIPELAKVANIVVDTIKKKDEEQYNSLLRSIGESP